jgi:hypothetical protein
MTNKLSDRKEERGDFLFGHVESEVKSLLGQYLTEMMDIDRCAAAARLSSLLTECVAITFNILAPNLSTWQNLVELHYVHLNQYAPNINFDGTSYLGITEHGGEYE